MATILPRILFLGFPFIVSGFPAWYFSASARSSHRGARMIEDEQSEWRQLCERASTEQDFQKLLELTNEILRLTEPKRKRFQAPPDHDDC
jgi:replication fork clamp-binding protein CrfC